MKQFAICRSGKMLAGFFFLFVFISIASLRGNILPAAFPATRAPTSGTGALFPVLGLIVAVVITQVLRRRRIAHLRSGTPSPH